MITSTYRPDVDNIAVFKQFVVKDPTHVDKAKYRVTNINSNLSTTGLASCTGLAMIIGTKKFMTHLDALTRIEPIIFAISSVIATEEIIPELLEPFIYAGNLGSSITLQKAIDICLSVGIPEINYKIIDVSMFDRVLI